MDCWIEGQFGNDKIKGLNKVSESFFELFVGQKLFRLKDDRLDGSSRWEKDRPTRNGDIVIYMKTGEFSIWKESSRRLL